MRWPDWLLLVCAACLVAVGPAMALQEFTKRQDEQAQLDLTGTMPPPDTGFRSVWRLPLTLLVLVAGLAGTAALVRTLLDPSVRTVTKPLIMLLLGSLALLDVTYYVDGSYFLYAPYALRGTTVVWLYSIAGVLLAGSTYRLAEVREYFAAHRPSFRL